MKSITITESDWNLLNAALFDRSGKESAGVLFCGVAADHECDRLLVRSWLVATPRDYLKRLKVHLDVSPAFYNRAVSECLHTGLVPVIVHSHPHSEMARYSASDDFGERRLLPVLEALTSTAASSMVIATHDVKARRLRGADFEFLDRITILGKQVKRIRPSPDESESIGADRFSRQVQIFGTPGQKTIEALKIGIVGVGGTGSLVAESLSRAGVKDILLIDHDVVEESNLTRIFGAFVGDIGKSKVDVVASHIEKLGGKPTTVLDSALKQSVLGRFKCCDLIFSCVDNDSSRAILNRFAYQYLIPVIDMGIRLDARKGRMVAAAGRVSVVMPGATCLRCSGHIDPERIRAEITPAKQREHLVKEGYILGISETVPSINSLNAVIAGLGVTAGLNLFVGLTGGEQPCDQLYDATAGEVFTVAPRHEPGCDICDSTKGLKSLGDLQIVSSYQ